ncbi:hypothetical protein Pmani_021431 [Petrolisthes manimaculis]|uniref:Uncharacterized protein n=1 Tax=Petrolisthes manimaculis TaxID=1843537 RepID=A0AAE1PGH2_9EUCA|nr:hypothetical protein Pmani_021431 [Petrolisthes manimaculis]
METEGGESPIPPPRSRRPGSRTSQASTVTSETQWDAETPRATPPPTFDVAEIPSFQAAPPPDSTPSPPTAVVARGGGGKGVCQPRPVWPRSCPCQCPAVCGEGGHQCVAPLSASQLPHVLRPGAHECLSVPPSSFSRPGALRCLSCAFQMHPCVSILQEL